MLTCNIDINDRLINGQIGTVKSYTVVQGKCETIYVLFDYCHAGNLRKREKIDSLAKTDAFLLTELRLNLVRLCPCVDHR